MPTPREFTIRIRFAVLGAACGCLAFVALRPFQESEEGASPPAPSERTGSARREPITASMTPAEGSNHARDIAAAEATGPGTAGASRFDTHRHHPYYP